MNHPASFRRVRAMTDKGQWMDDTHSSNIRQTAGDVEVVTEEIAYEAAEAGLSKGNVSCRRP
jgi:hypothetical protein